MIVRLCICRYRVINLDSIWTALKRSKEMASVMTALSLKSHAHLALQSVIQNPPSKWFGGQETKGPSTFKGQE